ncbi:MAG: nucleotidyltransferase family protein [Hyphomicrobiales bacterium]|nr:nucleotidyltransferase family protein [Hyphomicrobiales bacterium]
MWGIVPAAGRGSRIQPLAFSKELLPVGSRIDGAQERPCAVSEYLIERMLVGGVDKLCFVIAPGKSDIMEYYGEGYGRARAVYVVQPQPSGLCDAIFRARHLIGRDEHVLVGLPDTIWFPIDGFSCLPRGELSFLLFPVDNPQTFDAVVLDDNRRVVGVDVKSREPRSSWICGAFGMTGAVLHELYALWRVRGEADEYVGTLINAWLERGGEATGVRYGQTYVDVGTFEGYRNAVALLGAGAQNITPASRDRT